MERLFQMDDANHCRLTTQSGNLQLFAYRILQGGCSFTESGRLIRSFRILKIVDAGFIPRPFRRSAVQFRPGAKAHCKARRATTIAEAILPEEENTSNLRLERTGPDEMVGGN